MLILCVSAVVGYLPTHRWVSTARAEVKVVLQHDCTGKRVRNESTLSTVTVEYYDGRELLRVEALGNTDQQSCGPSNSFASGEWVNGAVTNFGVQRLDAGTIAIRLVIDGSDAFFIERLRVTWWDQTGDSGTSGKTWSRPDERGWCLSADPDDTEDWNGYLDKIGCQKCLLFRVAGDRPERC